MSEQQKATSTPTRTVPVPPVVEAGPGEVTLQETAALAVRHASLGTCALPPNEILALQRTIGNAAVNQLLRRQPPQRDILAARARRAPARGSLFSPVQREATTPTPSFTTGSNTFFQHDAYAPSMPHSLHMSTHDTARSVQQARDPVDATPTAIGESISDRHDRFERAAEMATDQVTRPSIPRRHAEDPDSRTPTTTHSTTGAPVQRQAASGVAERRSIGQMSMDDKFAEAIRRSAPHLGPELQQRIHELLTPESLAMMAGLTVVFAAAQFTPAGWAADVIAAGLTALSAVLMGPEIIQVLSHLTAFAIGAMHATTDADLDDAGAHFAIAVTKVGVDVLMAIIMHRVGKAAKTSPQGSGGEMPEATPAGAEPENGVSPARAPSPDLGPAEDPVGERSTDITEIHVSQADYEAALTQVLPSQYLDPVARTVDGIGQRAAQKVVANPRFIQAIRTGRWRLAGTLFHAAAAREARAAGSAALPPGWAIEAERVIQAGRGGSRADLLLRGPEGQIVEFDWKSTGRSALSAAAREEMSRHAGQIAVNVDGHLTVQESRSWVDFVRPLLTGTPQR